MISDTFVTLIRDNQFVTPNEIVDGDDHACHQ